MSASKERPEPNQWWKALFDYQREISRFIRTMVPEPFSSSLQSIEKNIILPMQESAERLSVTVFNNQQFVPAMV